MLLWNLNDRVAYAPVWKILTALLDSDQKIRHPFCCNSVTLAHSCWLSKGSDKATKRQIDNSMAIKKNESNASKKRIEIDLIVIIFEK